MLALREQSRYAVHEMSAFVSRSCLLLDEENFDEWLRMCAPAFNYKITVHSPDLNGEMCWLDLEREELSQLLATIPTQVRVPGTFFRSAGASFVAEESEERVHLVTPIVTYHTTPQGQTSLFAVCGYHDQLGAKEGELQLLDREVKLRTRLLDFGPHVIL